MLERTACYILLVEDNPLDVDLIQRAVENPDAPVTFEIVSDGEAALACLKRWEAGGSVPVVILLDLKLRQVTGLEVLQAIKHHPRFRILPVVVLTASDNADDIQRAYALGANSYIVKPNNSDEFSRTIHLIRRYWCGLNIHPE